MFASAMNFIGSHFVVQEPGAVQRMEESGLHTTVLTQAEGGVVETMPSVNGRQLGEIIRNPWSYKDQNTPSWLKEVDEETIKREAAIRAALNKRIDVKFTNWTLTNVLESLGEELKVEFVIDAAGLENEMITPEEPVTIDRTDVRGKDVLRQILVPLNLTTKIEWEAIVVTQKRDYANINRYYDLSAILPDNSLVKQLIEAIETTVAPDGWLNAGGDATISMVGSVMVVRAIEETQEEVAALLREVAKQNTENKKPLWREMPTIIKLPSVEKNGQGGGANETGH